MEGCSRTAFGWYLKAAEQGHAEAQAKVGRRYNKGNGVGVAIRVDAVILTAILTAPL